MSAPAATPAPDVAAAALHQLIARRVRHAQHVAAGHRLSPGARDVAEQVAGEIVSAVQAQFGEKR